MPHRVTVVLAVSLLAAAHTPDKLPNTLETSPQPDSDTCVSRATAGNPEVAKAGLSVDPNEVNEADNKSASLKTQQAFLALRQAKNRATALAAIKLIIKTPSVENSIGSSISPHSSRPDFRVQTIILLPRYSAITDDDLNSLLYFPELTYLTLGKSSLSPVGLRKLTAFKQLETLHLGMTDVPIGDSGLGPIFALKKLRELHLEGIRVSDAALSRIGTELPRLHDLALRGIRITEGAGKAISSSKTMSALFLIDCTLTEEGARELARSEKLWWLALYNCEVPDPVFKHIASMEHLGVLDLSRTKILPLSIKKLASAKTLTQLYLSQIYVGDECIGPLAEIKTLRRVVLPSPDPVTGKGLTKKGVERLKKAAPNLQIDGISFDD